MSKSLIVVSDLHLGGEDNYGPNLSEFCSFLEWIRDLPPEGRTMTVECKQEGGKTITIRPPAKLILLGDVLELWGPREQDRNSVIKDSTAPFSLLHEIDCDKIYITGNHDENMEEVAKKIKSFDWKGKNKFFLYPRHYPPENEVKKGIEVNGLRYSFLHGHQYDREQITYTLSRIINTRFDPIDFFQDLANVHFTKRLSVLVSIGLLILWLAFILLSAFLPDLIITRGIGAASGIIASAALFKYFLSSRKVVKERNVSGWFKYIFLIAFAGMIVILAAGVANTQIFSILYSIVFSVLTYLVLLSVIPRIITSSMRGFYNRFRKSKDKSAEEIVKENYFNLKKDTIDANVVVFGHTHQASTYLPGADELLKHKLFVNTGCWVNEKGRDVNTFVYIDPDGVYLLKWAGGGKIDCISHFTNQDIMRFSKA